LVYAHLDVLLTCPALEHFFLATMSGITTSTSASVTSTEMSSIANAAGPQATDKNANNRVEPGAVVGIAIGCLVAGLIIGIYCAWLLRRFTKSRSRRGRTIRIVHTPKNPDNDSPGSIESSDNKIKVENFILQATPDREVVGMLRQLEVIIEQHIENYYHVEPMDISASVLAEQLTNMGVSQDSLGFEAEAVAEWCLQPASRRLALQHVLSHVLFSSIDCNSRKRISLLPGPAINFLRSIRPVDKSREDFNGKILNSVLLRSCLPDH
jgi:hypothetical protein